MALSLEPATAPPAAYRVAHRRRESADTWTLELVPSGAPLAPFQPGQFAMLYAFGAGEVPISVSAGADGHEPLVHTIRAVGATTRRLCALPVGETVGVRGPFGTGWPLEAAAGRDVVVIAGGLGLAPLRPAIYELMRERERYGRLAVLCGARTPADLLFADELERWRGRFDVSVHVTVDVPDADWRGSVGLVTKLLQRTEFAPENTVAYLCGPEVMMRVVAEALLERGVPAERVWLSLERSMKCAVGHCGHCMLGPLFVCRDGPVAHQGTVGPLMAVPGL